MTPRLRTKPEVARKADPEQVGTVVGPSAALNTALVRPAILRGQKAEQLTAWATPKIEAARRRKRLSPAKLDQAQHNVLVALILEAWAPLVADVRTTKAPLRKLDLDHAGAVLRPVLQAVWALEGLQQVTPLDAAQANLVSLALSSARQAASELEDRASDQWRQHAKPNLGRRGARLSTELTRAFGVSQTTADEIAAKVLNISVREIQKARE